MSDSLSRLSYYDLYEAPKLEKPGFEFGKLKVEMDESAYKPLKTAYQDELSIFFLTQDPVGTPDTNAHEIHVKGDDEGVLKRIVRDNNMKIEVIVVPRDLTRTLLFEVHEALAHPGQLKMYMFLR